MGVEAVPNILFIDSIHYETSAGKFGDKHIMIDVSALDGTPSPVDGAIITLELFRNGVLAESFTGTTDATGLTQFAYTNAPIGSYTSLIKSVTHPTLVWDDVTPTDEEPFIKEATQ